MPGFTGTILTQRFEGTVTVVPRLGPVDYLNVRASARA